MLIGAKNILWNMSLYPHLWPVFLALPDQGLASVAPS